MGLVSDVNRLVLERLSVRSLRNLASVELDPAPRLNVVSGDHGHGKTTLLEAIYFAATSRSFRTGRLGEVLSHGAEVGSARARFVEVGDRPDSLAREQVAAIQGRRCVVRLDGNRPPSLGAYATRSPVVVFHPEELRLSTGAAPPRRTLVDRLALFLDPSSADHRARYGHALKARQRLLQGDPRGVEGGAALGLDAFEALCARHGAALTRARREAVAALTEELYPAFARIAAPRLELEARYEPGGSEDADLARDQLVRQRRGDAHRKSACFGPHRDDLVLLVNGRPARLVASQGQHRAITLALKAAETACIARVRELEPILLLDDVSSELDRDRTLALFTFLGLTRGQIFLTTTRPELILTPAIHASERRDWRLVNGALAGV